MTCTVTCASHIAMSDYRSATAEQVTVPHSVKSCPVCLDRLTATPEVFAIGEKPDRYVFNVQRAKRIVADGRRSMVLSEQTIKRLMTVTRHVPEHLAHVDPRQPGIILHRYGGLVLLDGIHRAIQAVQEKRTFYVYTLSNHESLACLLREDIY